MIRNEKAFQLSLNIFVTVIISLAILIFGMKFVYDLATEASNLEGLSTDQIDKRVENLLCDSTDRICIGANRKVIPKGNFDVFGVKILNILDSQNFDLNVQVTKLIKDDQEITENLDRIRLKHRNSIFIEKNQDVDIGLGVEVSKDALSGTYIIDVKVLQYDELQKVYVEVP